MSVLYSPTLRTYYFHAKKGTRNFTLKAFVFILIACFSCPAVSAQQEKETQIRKEAELKKQEEAAIEAKLRNNPGRQLRGEAKTNTQSTLQLTEEQQKQILLQKEAAGAAKLQAERRTPSYFNGVEYKVITTGSIVEYVVINERKEIFRQQVTANGSLYERQAQAEKEAIYASDILRRNVKYPIDALQSEIRSLRTNKPATTRTISGTIPQRVLADYTFNGSGGTINTSGPAAPYPATIAVSGVPAGAIVKSVSVNGINHTFSSDVDILLQSPTGINVFLMSDVGSGDDFVNHSYTFSDAAAANMTTGVPPASGTWKPTNIVGTLGPEPDNFVAPGPGAISQPNPTLSLFGNGNQNGTWSLFVLDDFSGDGGTWGSWSITFTDPPAVCFPIVIGTQPSNATICSGSSGTFAVAATPNGITYNWQVNTGSGFTYITNGGVYSGANTETLTITNPTPAMNGYQYRAVLTCSQGGLPEISNPATLTVLTAPSSPAVSPTSAAICPGGSQLILVGGGAQTTFSNAGPIAIPATGTSANPAAPYPSTIVAAGLPAQTLVKSVTITGLSHTFPDDIDIILKSPSGATVILMSDAGGSDDVSLINYTFDDGAASLLADGLFNLQGTYRPTNYGTGDNWPAPGPGTVNQATPTLGSLGAGNNNGNWELYVFDDAGGDVGSIAGWSITFEALGSAVFSPVTGLFTNAGLTTPYVAGTPVASVYASPAATTTYAVITNNGTCNSAPTNVTITVNQAPVITANPGNGAACAGGTKTFSVTATGATLTYQWQVDMGSGFVNITTGTPTNPGGFIYTGQTTATLTISDVLPTMNGYKYRVIVTGACTPSATSADVTISVSAVPAITITKSAACAPTSLTASGASTYSWAPSAGLSATTGATVSANPTVNTVYTVTGTSATGCVNTSQVDVKFTPPTPVVAPSAPVICSTAVQQLSVTSSSLPPVANTTSSGTVNLPIADGPPLAIAISNINVAGVTGSVQSISVNLNIAHSFDGDVTINLKAPNGNIYNLAWEVGGSGDNFTNTTFSSLGGTPIFNGTAPFTGTFAADAFTGVGIAPNLSTVSTWNSLFSVPNGTWTLICSDPYDLDDGSLISWSITINYAVPDAGIWTPVTGLFTNSAGTTPYVAGTPAATVYASPTATTTYSVAITNTSTETRTFSTGGPLTVPGVALASTSAGAAGPYPSAITVAGLPANAIIRSVKVKGVKHSFPDDIDMLLQSPTGVNVVLMSDAGGGTDATGQDFTFDDAAAGLMADGAFNATGIYRPTNFGASDTYPAPIGAINQATPTLASFTGDPNGTWNLYVADGFSGDIGSISSWEITFTLPTATNCPSVPRTVTVTVQTPVTFTTQPPATVSACQNNNVTITAAATGTIQTTQWQVSTNGSGGAGGNWTNVGGATSTTLTLTNVQPSQNGYKYRLVLSNTGCGSFNSNEVTLTVNPKPNLTVTLNPTGQTQLSPGMLTTISIGSTPAGTTYTWFVNGVAQPAITGSSYAVDAFHLGTYRVRVATANGCDSITAPITFTALPTSNLYIYPNPTSGTFSVTYYMPQIGAPVTMRLIDMKGRVLVERQGVISAPYTRFDFSNEKLAAGVYIVEFLNFNGRRLEGKQVVITR